MDIAHSLPRFRTDLVARPFDDAGQRFVDVTDPNTGNTFCFYDVEYYIACAMDGSRDVVKLATWAEDELGLAPSPAELESVISTLDELGYLEHKPAAMNIPSDVELGDAGVSSVPVDVPQMPTGMDVELGSAGRSEMVSQQESRLEVQDVALGLAGRASVEEPPPLEPVPLVAAAPPPVAPVMPPAPPQPEEVVTELSIDDAHEEIEDQPTTVHTQHADERVATGKPKPPRPLSTRLPAQELPGAVSEPIDLTSDISSEFDDSEVSVDLTDHLSLGAADVKEAVRQSRIMQAPEIPDAAERVSPPLPAGPSTPPIGTPAVPPAEARATELPPKPAVVTDAATARPVEPPVADAGKAAGGAKKSSLGLLLAILVVVALGAGAFGYWYLILKDKDDAGSAKPPKPKQNEPAVVKNEPPKPPPPPTATLAEVPADAVEVTAPSTGYVAEVTGADEEVEEGAVVVKLRGYQKYEKDLAEAEQRLSVYQKRLEDAQKSNRAGRIKAAEAKVKEKEGIITESRAALAGLVLTAPVAGTIRIEFKVNDAVEKDAAVFRVEPPPVASATFKAPGAKLAEGDDVTLAVDGSGKKGTCKVSAVEGDHVSATCGPDSGLSVGDKVVLGAAGSQ